MMFLPTYIYAKICHAKPLVHLGLVKKPTVPQLGMVILIVLACLPIIGALQEAMKLIPFSKETLVIFQKAEDDYFKQILVIGKMNSFGEYVLSLAMIALLPAIFEEVLFRGGIQNLLSRWTKMPILSICITAAIFSFVHGSYIGFLPRFVLGFVLGWLFYRTDKLWLSILAHFINNALGVTMMYVMTKMGKPITPNSMEESFPILVGVAALATLIGLLYAFDKISKKDIDKPGLEVALPGYINPNKPFEESYVAKENNSQ
jgi:membrane protease YdiL (CAAX protease family)